MAEQVPGVDAVSTADFLLGIHDDYRVFLRHYTEGFAETVMTFVP